MTSKHSIINTSNNNSVIANDIKLADGFLSRLKGLIGSKPLRQNQGLLISPCQQVHTHFMSYAIDVIFLDKQLTVIHIMQQMKPWKFSKFYKNAYYVLELAPHTSVGISINDVLKVINHD